MTLHYTKLNPGRVAVVPMPAGCDGLIVQSVDNPTPSEGFPARIDAWRATVMAPNPSVYVPSLEITRITNLLASAPDLYHALERMVEVATPLLTTATQMDALRGAIAVLDSIGDHGVPVFLEEAAHA